MQLEVQPVLESPQVLPHYTEHDTAQHSTTARQTWFYFRALGRNISEQDPTCYMHAQSNYAWWIATAAGSLVCTVAFVPPTHTPHTQTHAATYDRTTHIMVAGNGPKAVDTIGGPHCRRVGAQVGRDVALVVLANSGICGRARWQ